MLITLLELIPDIVWVLLFFVSITMMIAGQFLRGLPIIVQYRIPIIFCGFILLILSTWSLGAASNEQKWENRVKELEQQVAEAENKSNQVTTKIQEKIVEKTKIVREKGEVITKFIDKIIQGPEVVKEITKDLSLEEKKKLEGEIEELKNSLKECPVPSVILNMHNEAAKGQGEKK